MKCFTPLLGYYRDVAYVRDGMLPTKAHNHIEFRTDTNIVILLKNKDIL